MVSRADGVREHIADLLELVTAARERLTALSKGGHPYTETLRANLQSTIETIQRELARARQRRQRARGLDTATEILAKVKTQALEGRQAKRLAQTKAQAQQMRERSIGERGAAEAIVSSANTKAKKRKVQPKR